MPSAEAFPLYYPPNARRAFESDDITRRFATVATLTSGSRVLEVMAGRGSASVVLAKELGCEVLAVDADEAVVAALVERVKTLSLQDRIAVRRMDPARPDVPPGEFDAIVVQGRVVGPLEGCARTYRPFLATNGRLMLTYPAKVGRFPQRHALEFWEKRLGEPVRYPREVLQVIELCGFEPEAVETLDDGALAELYRGLEQKIDGNTDAAAIREEVDLFRGASNKASVSYAFAVARRKEPGEKPPASRDRG
ncbi:MAG TPA: methyltransferase domain-containing protein [Myxococcales bacterium]|nr:methyltransferase domain-containing protein [Myxococcales bacterium]